MRRDHEEKGDISNEDVRPLMDPPWPVVPRTWCFAHLEESPLMTGQHPRPSFTLSDTTFHFLDATPQEALAQAKAAANGKDVRIGGGVSTLRQFLEADLIDEMHVAKAPVELGTGLRLWDRPEDLGDRFHLEQITAPSGMTHCFFWRR